MLKNKFSKQMSVYKYYPTSNLFRLTKSKVLSLFVVILSMPFVVNAQTASIIVQTASLPAISAPSATTATPFTRINFATPFAAGTTPNIFPMTPEFGAGTADDPCVIRIRNIDNTGFDAVCLEPINEDRAAPAVSFDYIAIQNGTTSVPLVGGGTAQFQSSCSSVDEQIFGPRCDNCALAMGQSQGSQAITFSPAFTNPPALLTHIASTNNTFSTPVGEPETLVAAVISNSLSATGFRTSLDRMEAGNGTITSAEDICYLAVERNGCQELNLSTLGGPSSVVFNATFGGNVDGHSDGASTGEGATFAASCFSSTPVVLGGHRSRNGNNGGWLRLVSQNSSEAIFTFDEDRVSDTERNHIDEEISALGFSTTFTTPVTLSKASVSQRGRRTTFKWETSAEIFHLGFHLWGETDNGWEQLNRRLIPGQRENSNSLSRYQQTIKLSRQQLNTVRRFGISTVDNTGYEEFYGPFETGSDYGEESTTEAINWTQTREAYEQNMQAKGYTKVKNRWRRVSNKRREKLSSRSLGANKTILNLNFEAHGIHQISASDLLELAPEWRNTRLNRVALTLNGNGVARHIQSDNDVLDDGDKLIFYVKRPSGKDAIYLEHYNYQLRLDRAATIAAPSYNLDIHDDATISSSALVSVTPTQDRAYSAVLSSDRPWFDQRLVSYGSPASATYLVDFEPTIDTNQGGTLDILLVGGLDFPEPQEDHHALISLNGQMIGDVLFDGLVAYHTKLAVAPGLLKQTGNEISITVVGDTGLLADIIMVDELSLSAYRALAKQNVYDFPENPSTDAFSVAVSGSTNIDSERADLFAYTENGSLAKLNLRHDVQTNSLRFAALPKINSNAANTRYAISLYSEWPSAASINKARITIDHQQESDLLLVVHPNFIGEDLNRYIAFKTEHGYQPRVVNWFDLVETYGHGNNTPAALTNYLKLAKEHFNIQNVLLVGGHTYDYLGLLSENVVNFIPTNYAKVNFYNFGPTDNSYADLNADNLPDFAIGRWPVRSADDLKAIIQKNLDWQINRDTSNYQESVFIAQQNDARNLDFNKQMRVHLDAPMQQVAPTNVVHKIVMQDIVDSGVPSPVQHARELIRTRLNEGASLISFTGHGSFSSWGFQGVVNTDFVNSLENNGKPPIVMPLACYTTNYENPSINTLAHQWLFAGTQGAVAIQGASLLGDYRENGVFAERYLRQAQNSSTVGEAIMKAKNEMATGNDMLDNWAYLGDPTLPLR